MADTRVHLSVDDACVLGERAMRGIGYDEEEARLVTDHVVDAALCGYEYYGLAKLLNIPEHRRWAVPRTPIRLLHETPVSALYDGGNNVGMLAMYHATKATIAKAEAHGISVVGVTNSWMSGRSAYFVEMDRQCRARRDPHRGERRRGRAAWRDQAGARHEPDRLRRADR
jgi:LDH2 family malate/lactate/ureidoglycolate dehydrogenase